MYIIQEVPRSMYTVWLSLQNSSKDAYFKTILLDHNGMRNFCSRSDRHHLHHCKSLGIVVSEKIF